MHKLVWCSDIHLDHLREWDFKQGGWICSEAKVKTFCDEVMLHKPDSLVITGDLSEAKPIEIHLMWLEQYLPGIPIRFILGNHDYFHGSIPEVRSRMAKYDGTKTNTGWLNVMGVVKLTEKTALVGHDGWYDGGYSDWFKSKLVMNDYYLTRDFMGLPPNLIFKRLQELSHESELHIDRFVQEAAKTYPNVIFASHVPPFRDNSRAPDGQLSDPNWLPNMSSKMAGDALLRAAKAFPGVSFTSLSGHTHTRHEQTYGKGNLNCLTAQAEYGHPEVSIRVIEVE